MTKFATKMLLLGGLAAAGAAAAGSNSDGVPALAVRYNPDMLATDSGAHALYYRLTVAAEQVCPETHNNTHIVSEAILNCRKQAVASAVEKIHNKRLAAVYARATKASG